MDNDLDVAIEIISKEWKVTADEAEELMVILSQSVIDPTNSVLYPENKKHTHSVSPTHGMRRSWVTLETVYDHTFVFVINQTRAGKRFIAEIWPTSSEN